MTRPTVMFRTPAFQIPEQDKEFHIISLQAVARCLSFATGKKTEFAVLEGKFTGITSAGCFIVIKEFEDATDPTTAS